MHETRFLVRGVGYSLFLGNHEMELEFEHASVRSTVRSTFVGSDDAEIAGEQPLTGKINYLVSKDPKDWLRNIPTYGRVRYRNLYPGVDLLFHGRDGRLEYDFEMSPGTNPTVARMSFGGSTNLQVQPDGDLVINSSQRSLRWKRPVAYQTVAGKRKEINASYAVHGDQVSFIVGSYDRSRQLVIDPVLMYSTYLGGSRNSDADTGQLPGTATNSAAGIAVDSGGNVYVAGSTDAIDFPLKNPSSTQAGHCGGGRGECFAGFVTKFNPGGTGLIYSTYFGLGDTIRALAVDSTGRPYIAGSITFAVDEQDWVPASNQMGFLICDNDVNYGYLTVMTSDGSNIAYGTLYGGKDTCDYNSSTRVSAIAVGVTGVAYITGSTNASDLLVTPTAYRSTASGGLDGFVAKIDPSKSGTASLLYATYLGGSGDDQALGIATEGGRVYITGGTNSPDFPTTPMAFSRTFSARNFNAFVAKIDTNQSGTLSLVYSTYLGGSVWDSGSRIAVKSKIAYVAGVTASPDFPTTTGAYDRTYASNCTFTTSDQCPFDMFVTKLNGDGSSLTYSTYLGGSRGDWPTGLGVDAAGSAIVGGTTNSPDYPATANAFQRTSTSGMCFGSPSSCNDSVLTKLNPTGSALIYSTHLGGTIDSETSGMALDTIDNAYLTGNTASSDFPTTPGAFSRSRSGASDVFVTKFSLEGTCPEPNTALTIHICSPTNGSTVVSPIYVSATTRVGSSPIQSMSISIDGVKRYQWFTTTHVEAHVSMAAGSHWITIAAVDSAGALKNTVYVAVK